MNPIILVAETGSDLTAELAQQYNIQIVPMHVAFGDVTLDDCSFPVEKIVEYYKTTGKTPTTSGCTPEDFTLLFDRIHAEYPDAHILYLAYSAVTTCSYQSAQIAAEGRDYITSLDTRQVSAGQAAVVVEVAKALQADPDMGIDKAVEIARVWIDRARMCFLPENLDFLRAGGRVSNAVAMGSRILSLHPCIEILEGKLTATKKYRGNMMKVAPQLVREYSEKYNLSRDLLWLVRVIGLPDEVQQAAEQAAKECGFAEVRWIWTNGVITSHGGPGAFGMVGFARD